MILLLLPSVKYNIIVYYKLDSESDFCIDVKYNESFIDQTSADGKSMTREHRGTIHYDSISHRTILNYLYSEPAYVLPKLVIDELKPATTDVIFTGLHGIHIIFAIQD